jgi:hypothetical protein
MAVMAFASALAPAFAQEGRYRITSGGEVVSEYYDYSFRVPDGWNLIPNPAPLVSTMSMDQIRGDELIPPGQAQISFLATLPDQRVHSITEAISLDRRAANPNTVAAKKVVVPVRAHVEEAVAVSFDEDPGNGEAFLHYSKIYMNFGGRIAAFTLTYRKGDLKTSEYERNLGAIVSSFGRLGGPSAPDAKCPPSH